MEPHVNPILRRLAEDRGPTPLSTYGEKLKPNTPPKIPTAIKRLVSELGLRYRPSAQADLDAHAASLALLALDLADVPPHLLDRAIREWSAKSPYMPKASELIDLARKAQTASTSGTEAARSRLQAHCDLLNTMNWVIDSGCPYFVNQRTKEGGQIEQFVDRKS